MITTTLRDRYEAARTFPAYLDTAHEFTDFWRALYARAKVDDQRVARAAALDGPWHLLVLNEDWCVDAMNTLPFFARLTEGAPNVSLRVLSRDANPDLMDAHLTGTSRSIPVVMILDADFEERAWWGPRPQPMQTWMLSPEAQSMEKADRYKELRRLYARDQGVTSMDELLTRMERVTRAASPA